LLATFREEANVNVARSVNYPERDRIKENQRLVVD
jgi:hypothetical protein